MKMMDSRNLPATDSLRTPIIPFTHAFRPGGFDTRPIPAMNQASPQLGQNPYMKKGSERYLNSGTSVSRTDLASYRMGDVTKIPGAIFPGIENPPNPIIQPGRPAVTFENTGFNTFQPDYDTNATHALLKAIGNQQFKAQWIDPFSDYFNQEKLGREIQSIERTASLPEHQLAREIMRNVVAERREGNEADYMRRMLEHGMTAEDAQDEVDNIRRFNAQQASRTPHDRLYQSKLLLTRIAKSRGQLSSVNEPLDNHSAIMSPQPNELMAHAMGDAGAGFGNSPLDVNKVFKTPAYYQKMLRKSMLTQEQADKDTAIGNQIATESGMGVDEEGNPVIKEVRNSAITPSVVAGEDRYRQIENNTLNATAKLEALRFRGQSLKAPLPEAVFAPNILSALYPVGKAGREVLFSGKDVESMSLAEMISAINSLLTTSHKRSQLQAELRKVYQTNFHTWNDAGYEVTTNDLNPILISLIGGHTHFVRFPAVGVRTPINPQRLKMDIYQFINASKEQKVEQDKTIKRNTSRKATRGGRPVSVVETSQDTLAGRNGQPLQGFDDTNLDVPARSAPQVDLADERSDRITANAGVNPPGMTGRDIMERKPKSMLLQMRQAMAHRRGQVQIEGLIPTPENTVLNTVPFRQTHLMRQAMAHRRGQPARPRSESPPRPTPAPTPNPTPAELTAMSSKQLDALLGSFDLSKGGKKPAKIARLTAYYGSL